MKEFPLRLNPKNKNNFPQYNYERVLAYMRKDIFEQILLGNENDYFDIEKFAREKSINEEDRNKMINVIIEELKVLGWNTKTSFGNTGLFIYSTDEPPPSCHEDTL